VSGSEERGVATGDFNTVSAQTSLRDVARSAGVSVSTASRVISGSSHPVSQGTRVKVLAAAEQLGFEPNRLARALATARSQIIGVVVHDVSDPYFAEIVRGLEDGLEDHALFVASSDRDPDKELSLIRAFTAQRVDAIVLVASGLVLEDYQPKVEALLRRYEALGGVVVAMSEHSYQASRVFYDNRGATAALLRHVIDLGHRSIGYLSGPPELAVTAARASGYRDALEAAGLGYDPDLVVCGWFSIEGGAAAAAALMGGPQPTAIVAGNDLMAIGALRQLLDLGYQVPQDVSVAGFDDIEFAAYASVPLTTVRISLTQFGRRGADLVKRLLQGESQTVLPPGEGQLMVRASTGPPP
jgi:LacI family transcriptional regulator